MNEQTTATLTLQVPLAKKPPVRGEPIGLKKAMALIDEYQCRAPGKKEIKKSEIRSFIVDANIFRELLGYKEEINDAKAVEYIRFFIAKKVDLAISPDHTMVIVGVDKDGQNLVGKDYPDRETLLNTSRIYENLGTNKGQKKQAAMGDGSGDPAEDPNDATDPGEDPTEVFGGISAIDINNGQQLKVQP